MRWLAATLLAVALAVTVSTPSAFAKGKPPAAPAAKTKTTGKVTSRTGVNAGGFVCDNQWEMQSTDTNILVCFNCPTAPDGPAGAVVWVPQVWSVVRGPDGLADPGEIALVQYTFGCADWYYFA